MEQANPDMLMPDMTGTIYETGERGKFLNWTPCLWGYFVFQLDSGEQKTLYSGQVEWDTH